MELDLSSWSPGFILTAAALLKWYWSLTLFNKLSALQSLHNILFLDLLCKNISFLSLISSKRFTICEHENKPSGAEMGAQSVYIVS